ncbi:MAG: indolepyruvate ferredoxin oxidoreductase family protein [Pseudomonadota bacterium]
MFDAISLDDKYKLDEGRIFISGTQALVRLPLMQRRLDAANGLSTAGFISGYRGSPLGNYDAALSKAKSLLEAEDIHFLPGVNEDLAATSCWGTQQTTLYPGARYDGVFAMWYGKGPGVDRSGDPLKHGNLEGTSPHGGVIVLAGDDHVAKSSTIAFQSEPALIAAGMPIFNPADVQDYLDLGLHAFALSRMASVWVGFKCLTETIETTFSAYVSPQRFKSIRPPALDDMPDVSIKAAFTPVADEQSLMRYRLPAAQAYVRANKLDRVMFDGPRRELGVVTTGKSYGDLRQALKDLGLSEDIARELGLRIYKIAMVWPLEPEGLRNFAAGHRELLFVEEKRPIVEEQAASILFNLPAGERPRIAGKRTPDGAVLTPSDGELSPAQIALIVAGRLKALGLATDAIEERAKAIAARLDAASKSANPGDVIRTPAFCSGCPHNSSTRVPEGSLAMGGIGCHTMAIWMPDRPTAAPTHMGGEGANWIGMAPFTEMKHVFQNMGDGTYFHSGLIALRAAVAANVNVTYKILYNSVVAMTGGQSFDGDLSVSDIASQVMAEGVTRVAVVSDEPEKHEASNALPAFVTIHHRDELIALETELREVEGVSVIIYDQGCAADKRRKRKRGDYPDPNTRYFINESVCEGCGDCSAKSTCVSIAPKETVFGRKRRIDQSSCNKDYSCVNGFCPSFVTVTGGRLRKRTDDAVSAQVGSLQNAKIPDPEIPNLIEPCSMLVAGIGGTGVVTIGAVLGMAAHLEGKGCLLLDITGLAQKNGAVLSHVQFAASPKHLSSARIGPGKCNLLLACDLIVGAGPEVLATFDKKRTRAVANLRMTATVQFQFDPDMDFQSNRIRKRLEEAINPRNASYVDASSAAERLLGDSIGTNMCLVGFAYQQGLIPLSGEAIVRAIELNGVAVTMNTQAFEYGRVAAHEGDEFWARFGDRSEQSLVGEETLHAVIARRTAELTEYQDKSYAETYAAFVKRVWRIDQSIANGVDDLTDAVARSLFKLMAYKDEYEVARLFTREKFRRDLAEEFEGDYKVSFNLAPPLFARRDPITGEPKKMRFGSWMMPAFSLLARGKRLRGTQLDVFGRTAERRVERRLIDEYRDTIEKVIAKLETRNYADAVTIARLPEEIRGYGHIKEKNIEKVEARRVELLNQFESPGAQAIAVAV